MRVTRWKRRAEVQSIRMGKKVDCREVNMVVGVRRAAGQSVWQTADLLQLSHWRHHLQEKIGTLHQPGVFNKLDGDFILIPVR